MRKRYLLLLLTLIFGAALLAVDRYTASWEQSTSERNINEPDYYGDGLISDRFDANGKRVQRLQAHSSVHYPATRHTEFQRPLITALDQQSTTWQIQAASGVLSDGEQQLTLSDNVEVRTVDRRDAIVITTSELHYDIEQQVAHTEQPVRIDHMRIQISAVGMTLDLKRQRMRFHQEVNTQYDPTNQ
ncbi:LPS export ABC transporter periplasmic protein LptC [Bacterioplanes sanyensis]|uniref:Lipopolysaccharide export system protein LptC n=1 Tax=Bacterioplanes sanyensis TaxID=1249553 RepID=A0A222FJI1_9GAMM|nr:LPS export ABC transporter periplasmic protein LptC [Bacterioplanes sanyensis]ASP38746.1 LPS export ABC transporter periplasmic protein LptC [Bacterioplanes sanyensis]